MSQSSEFTHHDVEQILRVVDGLSDVEVRFESGDIRLHVRKCSGAAAALDGRKQAEPAAASELPRAERPPIQPTAPASARAGTPPASGVAAKGVPQGALEIRAPMLGRFYRATSPTEPPYVEVGRSVNADDTVCIIEVMKLFNTVKSGVKGTIVSIEVENGAMVEYDQLLFVVEPD